jgi:tetratricopeptide (TPR) repeat protein
MSGQGARASSGEIVKKLTERGIEVTNASDEAIGALNSYTRELLALGNGVNAITAAARAMPECPMLQACAASAFLYTQSLAEAAGAARYLARAEARLDDVTERERIFIASVRAGLAGDFETALAGYEQIVDRWPHDTLAAKLAEFHFFETGAADRQLRVMSKAAEANPDVSHVLAMHAFALELNQRRADAERVANAALAIDPLTMWAQHCLAHVWSGDSRVDEGIAAMRGFAPTWKDFSHYTVAHNSFHLGALLLDNRDFDSVRALYRENIWGFERDAVVELTDAILLLWYVELAGGRLDGEWREIASHARKRAHEHVFPFLKAIFLYALARAGERDTVAEEIARLKVHADAQSGGHQKVWREIGLPLVEGSVAFAYGDYDRAAATLAPILPEVACAGGSDEQRGVFIQSHIVSLVKSAGDRERAQRAIHDYIAGRPVTPLERFWLAEI